MSTHPDSSALTSDLLRSVIREVLQDVVGTEVAAAAGAGRPSSTGAVVRIASQADLDAAIRRILADASDPKKRADIETGRVRFRLVESRTNVESTPRPVGSNRSTGQGGQGSPAPPGNTAPHHHAAGPLTERHVIAAARETTVIVIGQRVVVTPLARERARATGVEIRRER